uniref:Putative secreted protein n=1 Tax=Ixodes ricinus TaxID=34613 RepID=A0A6B0UPU4_IXORI
MAMWCRHQSASWSALWIWLGSSRVSASTWAASASLLLRAVSSEITFCSIRQMSRGRHSLLASSIRSRHSLVLMMSDTQSVYRYVRSRSKHSLRAPGKCTTFAELSRKSPLNMAAIMSHRAISRAR